MPPRHRQETGNNSKYERLKQLRLIIEPQNTRHGALTLFTRIFQNREIIWRKWKHSAQPGPALMVSGISGTDGVVPLVEKQTRCVLAWSESLSDCCEIAQIVQIVEVY